MRSRINVLANTQCAFMSVCSGQKLLQTKIYSSIVLQLFIYYFLSMWYVETSIVRSSKVKQTRNWYNSEMLLVNIWDTCTMFLFSILLISTQFFYYSTQCNAICECHRISKYSSVGFWNHCAQNFVCLFVLFQIASIPYPLSPSYLSSSLSR